MRQVATAARIYRIPVCLRKITFSCKLSYQFVYFCLLSFGIFFFIESARYNSSTSSSKYFLLTLMTKPVVLRY
jgi:hypothetical protein